MWHNLLNLIFCIKATTVKQIMRYCSYCDKADTIELIYNYDKPNVKQLAKSMLCTLTVIK